MHRLSSELNSPKPTKQRQKFKSLLQLLILILEKNTLQTILIEYIIRKPMKASNLILTNSFGLYLSVKQKLQIEKLYFLRFFFGTQPRPEPIDSDISLFHTSPEWHFKVQKNGFHILNLWVFTILALSCVLTGDQSF